MKWVRGADLLDHAREVGATHVAFTANYVVKRGRLVMGAGAAKRVRDALPGVDAAIGRLCPPSGDYHLICVEDERWNPKGVLAVQVKRHYSDDGDWDLAVRSLRALAEFCEGNRDAFVVMNCPLVGRGGFADRSSEVESMVEEVLCEHPVLVTTL